MGLFDVGTESSNDAAGTSENPSPRSRDASPAAGSGKSADPSGPAASDSVQFYFCSFFQ